MELERNEYFKAFSKAFGHLTVSWVDNDWKVSADSPLMASMAKQTIDNWRNPEIDLPDALFSRFKPYFTTILKKPTIDPDDVDLIVF